MSMIIHDTGYEFLRPFIAAALPKGTRISNFADADGSEERAVMISTTDVYPGPAVLADETAAVDENSALVKAERDFMAEAKARGLRATVLRCAPLTGTGMTGFVRGLANDIYRGLFFHFPDNEARFSVAHATDVAAVVAAINNGALDGCGDSVEVYNLTDGDDPTLHDLAEALAFRMNEKRISTLSTHPQQMMAKVIYGRRYRRWTTGRTFDGSKLRRATGIEPTVVCDYLRNHVYDDSSL